MKKTRNEMTEETRAKLIQSARLAFGENGYAQTSMDEFTASVGLTRGALYHHFGDKRGLLLAVVEVLDEEMDARLREITENESDLWTGFVGRCRLYLSMSLEPEIQRIVLRDAPSILTNAYSKVSKRRCLDSLSAILLSLIETGRIKSGDPATLARLINGALVDAALWIADGEDAENRLNLALENMEVLLSGLKIPPQ